VPQALFQNQRTVAQSRIANEDQSRQRQNYLCVPAFLDFRSRMRRSKQNLLLVAGPSTVSIDNSAVIFLLSERSS
jgi:hypothetical protein